jgi:hypothetical protein
MASSGKTLAIWRVLRSDARFRSIDGANVGEMSVTGWDIRVFVRAATVALLALGLAWILTAATDEGGLRWGERAGRTLPLVPVCAAIGVWGALSPVRSRGEARALEALGRTRAEVAAPAVAGGAFIALAAALALVWLPTVSVTGFYPTARHAEAWRWEAGGFVDPVRRLRVADNGELARATPVEGSQPEAVTIPAARAAAGISMVIAGGATALLLAHAMLFRDARLASGGTVASSPWWPLGATGLCAAASIVLFQAAAVEKVPALAGTLPSVALLAVAMTRYFVAP